MEQVALSNGEWRIMTLLWDEAPRTIMQITHGLEEQTGWEKNTVITMLKRMEAKGAVGWKAGQRAKLYYPCVAQDDVVIRETENFLDKVYRGSVTMMMNTLVEHDNLSDAEIRELYAILDRARKK